MTQGTIAPLRLAAAKGGRFAGYASLFGAVDLAGDAMAAGAFAASLARRGAGGVRMLFQHDPGAPIGRWLSIEEDGRGLRVEGELSMGVERAREVRALMEDGALDGLSVGFRTVKARGGTADGTAKGGGVRRILEADLWEISVVTFPMLPGARVTSLKSIDASAGLAASIRRATRLMAAARP